MDPVAFRIFGLEVKWYGVLIVLGVALGMLLCARREQRFSLPKDTTVNLILIALPLALVCARAYYVIFSWDYYSAHPDRILSVRDGGLAIYGGLLGGMLGAFLYARHAKIPFMQLADVYAPPERYESPEEAVENDDDYAEYDNQETYEEDYPAAAEPAVQEEYGEFQEMDAEPLEDGEEESAEDIAEEILREQELQEDSSEEVER